MIQERLFYFIHGLATMFFLFSGLHRIFHKEASRLEQYCGYVLLYWSMLEFKDLIFYFTHIIRENYISNLLILIDMTAVPAGCFLIIELLNSGWFNFRRATTLTSPFLFAVFAYAIFATDWIVDVTFVFVWVYSVGFAIYMLFSIRRYNRHLAENYSNTECVDVRWLNGVAIMLAACLIVWTFSCYYTSWITDSAYQIVLMSMWMVVLYFADRQQAITPPIHPNAQSHAESVLSTVSERKLHQSMENDQLWLKPRLTLSELAAHIGTNRTYLSNYLNTTHYILRLHQQLQIGSRSKAIGRPQSQRNHGRNCRVLRIQLPFDFQAHIYQSQGMFIY